jgi:hypothetical protein
MFTIDHCKNVAITFSKSETRQWIFMKFGTKKFYWLRNSCRLLENLNQRDHMEGVDEKIILKYVLKK